MEFDTSGPEWKPLPHPKISVFNETRALLLDFAQREHKSRHPEKFPVPNGQAMKKPKNISPADDPVIRGIKKKIQSRLESSLLCGRFLSNRKSRQPFRNLLTLAERLYSWYIDNTGGMDEELPEAIHYNLGAGVDDGQRFQPNSAVSQSISPDLDWDLEPPITMNPLSGKVDNLECRIKKLEEPSRHIAEISDKVERVVDQIEDHWKLLMRFRESCLLIVEDISKLKERLDKVDVDIEKVHNTTRTQATVPDSVYLGIANNKNNITDIDKRLAQLDDITKAQEKTIKELKSQLEKEKTKLTTTQPTTPEKTATSFQEDTVRGHQENTRTRVIIHTKKTTSVEATGTHRSNKRQRREYDWSC